MAFPRPLYQQVKEFIKERINSGQWPTDTKIPSENELLERLGVSRMTVNRALRELTSEGRLVRIQGVGTFVSANKPQYALLEIRSIVEEIEGRGGKHNSEVRLLREEQAVGPIAELMDLEAQAPVFHSIIIHRDNGKPVLVSERYVNPSVVPEFLKQDFSLISPTRYLIQTVPVTEIEHIIEAEMPDGQTRSFLELDALEPCLVLHRRTWSGKTVITKSRLIYPGSRYRLGSRFKPASGPNTLPA